MSISLDIKTNAIDRKFWQPFHKNVSLASSYSIVMQLFSHKCFDCLKNSIKYIKKGLTLATRNIFIKAQKRVCTVGEI